LLEKKLLGDSIFLDYCSSTTQKKAASAAASLAEGKKKRKKGGAELVEVSNEALAEPAGALPHHA
jgi:hypothetical protein